MRKTILVIAPILIVLCFATCKKKSQDDVTNTKPTTFFSDTADEFTGLVYESDAEFQSIPVVTLADTVSYPYFRITSHSSSYEIPESDLPPPRKQTNESCSAFATAYGMLGYQYHKIENNVISPPDNLAEQYSAAYVYNQLNGGLDKGISIKAALELLENQGTCKIQVWDKLYDFTSQPTTTAIDDASYHKITSYGRLGDFTYSHEAILDLIREYVTRNYPLPFGCEVDGGFMHSNLNSFQLRGINQDKLVWVANAEADKGSHAMLIVGYDDAIHALKVMNSWGKGWGQNGFIWIDYDFFFSVLHYNLFGSWIFIGLTNPVTAIKYYLTKETSRTWKWDPNQPNSNCCGMDFQLDDEWDFFASNNSFDSDPGPYQSCPDTCEEDGQWYPGLGHWSLTLVPPNTRFTLNIYATDTISMRIDRIEKESLKFLDGINYEGLHMKYYMVPQ